MKIRRFTYTKDNGEVSQRTAIVVSEPRDNYLMYDVSDFTETEMDYLKNALEEANECREECLAEFEAVTGKQIHRLWRSFKPGGIEWVKDSD